MGDSFLIAIVAGLLGMLGWGISDLFAKKTIDAIGDITTLVIAHIFGAGFVVLIALYEAFFNHRAILVPEHSSVWIGLIFFGALQAVVYLFVYIGFGKGQVAVLNPIFSSFSGIVAAVSILFLGEIITGGVIGALVITFAGVTMMNLDLSALRQRHIEFTKVPGFPEIALATLLAALWTLGWSSFVGGMDWLSYALWMYLSMTATLLAYAFIRGVSLKVTLPSAWKYLMLIGLFEMGAYVAVSWGYSATNHTSIVAVLSAAFSLPTIIGARLWLQERTTRLQLIGSLAIVTGVVLISLH